jgi:hypothetical protein
MSGWRIGRYSRIFGSGAIVRLFFKSQADRQLMEKFDSIGNCDRRDGGRVIGAIDDAVRAGW